MAFDKDTPQVKEWMADYSNGKISAETAARLDVGGTGGEFGNITEEECDEEYTRIIIDQLTQDMENGMILDVKKLEKGTNLRMESWQDTQGTGIRASLEKAGVSDCIIAQIEQALPITDDIPITGDCSVT